MGQVYRAFDERLERRVALKQILPDSAADTLARQRFLREARAAASLNHPAIVQIHDILEVDGCDWIVMELVDGDTLDELVERGALPADRIVALAFELASGLEAAHAEGIVHRDLKAKNVLVNRKGRAKILDFGLAKPMQRDELDVSISIAGQVVGTPRAMSPEQATGGEVDHRSDLFSLGTLLYEMATGTSPFTAPGVIATVTRVCTHRQEPAHEVDPAVPRELSALIDRLLEKEPSHRPQTAREVIEALRELAGSVDLPSPGASAAVSTSSAETYDGTGKRQPTAERQRATVERRQITVMACELIDAEESTGGLDPETLVEVVPDFHALVRAAIATFGGHLGSGLGHRLVVYFGYPQAHEDDARRAVKAALRILAEIADANAGAGGERLVKLAVRLGVHTGVAVVMPETSR
jgi:serine/threonine protein kinase